MLRSRSRVKGKRPLPPGARGPLTRPRTSGTLSREGRGLGCVISALSLGLVISSLSRGERVGRDRRFHQPARAGGPERRG
jgi:hypothetical protein